VLGILDTEAAERILSTQHALGLPIVRAGLTVDLLLRGVHEARRHRGGQLRMPVLCGIGAAIFINEISETQLGEALAFTQSWSSRSMLEARQSA